MLLNHNPIYSTIKSIVNFNSSIELEYTDLTDKLVLVTGEVTGNYFNNLCCTK
jgi:hypothetical protein